MITDDLTYLRTAAITWRNNADALPYLNRRREVVQQSIDRLIAFADRTPTSSCADQVRRDALCFQTDLNAIWATLTPEQEQS